MAQYNYYKYTVNVLTNWNWELQNLDYSGVRFAGAYKDITFDHTYKRAIVRGGQYTEDDYISEGQIGYVLDGAGGTNFAYKWVAKSSGYARFNLPKADGYASRAWEITGGSEAPGSFVGSVVAENGTYPTNGKHTDGYWYVKADLYNPNTPPTTPGKPVATGDFRAGGDITISWPASTDAQGQSIEYTLQRNEYRGSVVSTWINTLNTSVPTTRYTLPSDTTLTHIEFRVNARDSLNAYSANSPTSDKYNLTNNKVPTINLTTIDGRKFYENETFLINGTATDADIGNIVSVKYQINSEPVRAIETKISSGTSIPFNKTLTMKNSRLMDGTTPVTEVLGDGSQHILKVWAEDDQGGKSPEQIRSFYVVANRAPVINVDNIANQTGAVNADTITITGRASDPDGNAMTAKYRVNTGPLNDLPLTTNGEWTLSFPIKQLVDGENSVIIEATDSYNFKSSKTVRLKKEFKSSQLGQSVQRYKIEPPKGSAKGVILWVQREEAQRVSAEISMVDNGATESYVPMDLTVTAPIGIGNVEDEFVYEADAPRTNIHLKLNITGTGSVTLISGVLS